MARTRLCRCCGKERHVPEEMGPTGRATCHVCTQRNRRRDGRIRSQQAPRQSCARCGGEKPRGRGRRLCDTCRARPLPHCFMCGAELPAMYRRVCDACQEATRKRRNASKSKWNRQHSEMMLEARRRWDRRNPERKRAAQAAYWQRLKADPVAYARHLENRRMCYRLRAMAAGRPIPPVPEDRYDHINSQWTLEADPLRELVLPHRGELEVLADRAGVSPRLISRLLHEDGRVSVWAADRIAVSLGLHLDLIYPQDAA